MRDVPSLAALLEVGRARLEISEDVPVRGWWVYRPDDDRATYALVEFGPTDAVVAVAALSPETGEPVTWARLPGTGSHVSVSGADARATAGMPDASTRLVWKPSRQSASPLYPVWEVRSESRAPRYVDLAGRVWDALEESGPGG